MTVSDWILRLPLDKPQARLICLPHAGASAAYFLPWRRKLDPAIELCIAQYPGRGVRIEDAPLTDMNQMTSALAIAFTVLPPLPSILFGHSLGALLGFEIARVQPCPVTLEHLYLSACRAPRHVPAPFVIHAAGLPEHEFFHAIGGLGGLPADLLDDPELRRMFGRALRADFQMAAGYQYRPGPLLPMPVTLFCGDADDHVPLGELAGWAHETAAPPALRLMQGGHFFITEPGNLDCIIKEINMQLTCNEAAATI